MSNNKEKSMLDIKQKDKISNSDIEMVQDQQHEYSLLGTFARTKGLKLYELNHKDGNLSEVNIKYSDTATVVVRNGKLTWVDLEAQETTIDTRNTYFEALNERSACVRVEKFKRGEIAELFNLKKPTNNSIKLN